MASMAVFDSPQLPHDWQGREVIRVIDPLGCAAAWVDPALAGAVVGFHARKSAGKPWSPVIESLPLEQAGQPLAVGCELLLVDGAGTVAPAWRQDATWRFGSRNPTEVITNGAAGPQRLSISSRCHDGVLQLSVTHDGEGGAQVQAGFGVHLRDVDMARSSIAKQSACMRFAREQDAIDGVDCLGSSNLTCTWREGDVGEWQRLEFLPDSRAVAPLAKNTILAELTIVPVAGR